MEVYVDKTTAPKLNSGVDKLEDILVMHLEGGKDLFVSFAFHVKKTSASSENAFKIVFELYVHVLVNILLLMTLKL